MNHVPLARKELLNAQHVSILSLQLLIQMEHVINVMLLIVPHAHLNQYAQVVWKALS